MASLYQYFLKKFSRQRSVIVGFVYKDLHDLLQAKSYKIRHVQTRIMMAAMDPKPIKLQENVILTFKNLKLSSFILARVTRKLTTVPQTEPNKIQRVRLGIKACVLIIPLLGITWLFGLLSPLHKAFTYIFIILNSTQGVLIFILHCMRNSEIRERLEGKIKTETIGQVRARMKARTNAVFPSPNDRNS